MVGVPAQKRVGTVRGVYAATEGGFETRAVPALTLTYDGIPGDRHAGMLRPSGPREPWHPRGTEMRNERQLSILGADELLAVAERLGIERLEPEWIGGNLVLAGTIVPGETVTALIWRQRLYPAERPPT